MPGIRYVKGAPMAPKREDHLQKDEEHARRDLDQIGRRWPTNSNVYYVLLVVVLIIVLLLAFR